MKGYTITALLLAATSLLQAERVDIELYNNTGRPIKLERNYLPGTPQAAPMTIGAERNVYQPTRLGNQDLNTLDNYTFYYENSKIPAAKINANELAQRAEQVRAKEILISLDPAPGYLSTGIKVKITPRGSAELGKVAPNDEDFVLVGEKLEEFEPIEK